jgi:hypothetical protein
MECKVNFFSLKKIGNHNFQILIAQLGMNFFQKVGIISEQQKS